MEGTPRKVYEHKPRYLLAPSKNIQPSTTLLGQLNPLSPALFFPWLPAIKCCNIKRAVHINKKIAE